MNHRFLLLIALLPLLALQSCRTLESESGLYDVPLKRSYKMGVDGAWTWGKGRGFKDRKKGRIYIAPMDISRVEKDEPECAPLLVQQMHDFMKKDLGDALDEINRANGTDWALTDKQAEADIGIHVALVHFRRQRPGLRILTLLGGPFIKVPGVSNVVGSFSEGDICVEATVRNAHTGELMLAFKDSNRKTAKLYSAEAYSQTGNADANLRAWAGKLAKIFRSCAPDKAGDKTLEQQVKDRNVLDAAKAHLSN